MGQIEPPENWQGTAMSIDRHLVDQLLRSITLGQTTPESAARKLLAHASQTPFQPTPWQPPRATPAAPAASLDPMAEEHDSIESLIARFGEPPAEIASDWQRQIADFAEAWLDDTGSPLPPVSSADWWVDSQNRLTLNPRAVVQPSVSTSVPLEAKSGGKSAAKSKRRWSIPLAVVGLLMVAAVAVGVSPTQRTLTLSSPAPTSPPRVIAPPLTALPLINSAAGSPTDETPLGFTMDQPAPPAAAAIDFANVPSDWGLSNPLLTGLQLDSFLTDSASEQRGESPDQTATDFNSSSPPVASFSDAGPELSDAESMSEDEPADVVADSRPIESSSPLEAITLPPILTANKATISTENPLPLSSVVVAQQSFQELRWDFPVATKLSFHPRSTDDGTPERNRSWVWTDSTDQAELATLHTVDEQLIFQWTPSASTHPLARQISAGRLSLVDPPNPQTSILMRPQLRTPALRFELEQPDNRLTWPLQGPPIFSSPELTLEPFTPEKIEWIWLQTPDPRDVRKQTATLQWALAGKPSPLIQCRIECRANTRLQMRLRYLVQLEPHRPWQPFSAPQLLLAIDYVTQTLERAVAQQTELQGQYRAATTSDKRAIKPLKDATEATVKRLSTLLQQLQQLNLLQSAIAAEAYLSITLTTAWPQGNQMILQTPPPDR